MFVNTKKGMSIKSKLKILDGKKNIDKCIVNAHIILLLMRNLSKNLI